MTESTNNFIKKGLKAQLKTQSLLDRFIVY